MSTKLVSVITPLYNSELYIQACINSVISQTYNNLEMIIIDDCSTDKSVDIVNSFKDNRIKLISLKDNSGTGIARNYGIKCATGRYIAFLDADDFWHPSKIEKQINFMEKNNLSFSFTSYFLVNIYGSSPKKYVEALEKVNYNKMLRNNYIGCLTAVYDTQYFGKIYMPDLRKRQDWGLWLILLKKTVTAKSIKEPLAFYRIGNESLSKNKINLLISNFEFYKEHLGFSFFVSLYKMILFLYYHFIYKKKYIKEV